MDCAAVEGVRPLSRRTETWMRAALRYGAITLTIFLFLLSIRRSGERVGRLEERF